ncbi:hypothetical protein DPMN_006666 [Dreissena polymorpha]|uniref:Uncharacterized protein n=1 Tax=Dreissena polymorpha TaxID=45954 RepID=A0A9D4LIQ3_DREPO|nr:hypothetical protein DPMN_102016 [Dreissena polymorpha]KAH3882722.1 hypothetical protein DPMN_006666 [Dreissena polymorpha]
MASHNSKYYVPKIRKKDAKNTPTISSLFKKQTKKTTTSGEQPQETDLIHQTEVTQPPPGLTDTEVSHPPQELTEVTQFQSNTREH